MPLIKGPMLPGASGSERFKFLLERTHSAYVYQDELKKKVSGEVAEARQRALSLTQQADGLEQQYDAAVERAEAYAKRFAETGAAEDELERSGAKHSSNTFLNDFRRLRSAAREWTALADGLEAEFQAFMAKLAVAQAEAAIQASP